MAKFTPIAGQITGRLEGAVYSKNKYGHYVRAFRAPRQPGSTPQMQVRAHFLNASTSWRALSEAQRAAWNAYAAETKRRLPGGETGNLTGIASYVSVFTVARLAGITGAIGTPSPGAGRLAVPDPTGIEIVGGSMNVAQMPSGATHVVVWVQLGSAGRNQASGPWTLYYAGTVANFQAGQPSGLPIDGPKVWVKIRLLSNVTWTTSDVMVGGPYIGGD